MSDKIVSWEDSTLLFSCIDNVYLDAEETWEKCKITITCNSGRQMLSTITLIVNGELSYPLIDQIEISENESLSFYVTINSQVTLIVAGYIKNNGITSGSVTVQLSATYS